jgi:hypothetical protein
MDASSDYGEPNGEHITTFIKHIIAFNKHLYCWDPRERKHLIHRERQNLIPREHMRMLQTNNIQYLNVSFQHCQPE